MRIDPVRTPFDKFKPEVVVFDPLSEVELDHIIYFEERIGTLLTPIGQYGEEMCLYMAQDGSVFSSWNWLLWKRGVSLIDALENSLVFARREPELVVE